MRSRVFNADVLGGKKMTANLDRVSSVSHTTDSRMRIEHVRQQSISLIYIDKILALRNIRLDYAHGS